MANKPLWGLTPNAFFDLFAQYKDKFIDTKKFLNDLDITIVQNKTYELLSVSSAAIVTSGTATLETALFKVPQIVCYKSSFISYIIAKLLVKIKYISLVNLIMDKEIVKELIQQNCNKDSISLELNKILNPDHKKK